MGLSIVESNGGTINGSGTVQDPYSINMVYGSFIVSFDYSQSGKIYYQFHGVGTVYYYNSVYYGGYVTFSQNQNYSWNDDLYFNNGNPVVIDKTDDFNVVFPNNQNVGFLIGSYGFNPPYFVWDISQTTLLIWFVPEPTTTYTYDDNTTSTSNDFVLTDASRNTAKTLISVQIGDGVTSIGPNAFVNCTQLTELNIPSSVTSIGYYAVSGCFGLTNIVIPDSVTSIDYNAFQGCIGLTSITLSQNLISIGNSAFNVCSGLTTISIPASVNEIYDSAFATCANLSAVYFEGNAPSIASTSAFANSFPSIFYCIGATGFTDPYLERPSYEIDCSSLPPASIAIETQPLGVVSGDPLSTQPVIKILDAFGDVIPTATNSIEATITIVNGSGSLSGTTTVNAVNGYATFTDLTFTGDASFYLTFTATGLTPVDSDEIATLTPVSILMETQPVAGASGDQFLTQPVVKIVNWLNEIVPTYSDDVVCTLVVVSGSPVLTGTTTVTPSSGYATYTDLVVTGSGSFYLQFTSGSLNQVDSNTIYFLPDPGNPNPPIPVKPKRSYIPMSVPTANDMEINEFAINVVDKKGYVCDSNGVVHQVFDGSQGVSSIIAGTGISVNNSTGNVTISTIASSPSLEQLTDVQITNKQDGQVLRYLVSGQKWVNSNIIDGGNF